MLTPTPPVTTTRYRAVISPTSPMSDTYAALSILNAASATTLPWGPGSLVGMAYPFQVNEPLIAYEAWSVWGTTGTGNFDVGIFELDGTLLVNTGTTAKNTIAQHFNINITDTTLFPNKYYYAGMVADTGTDTYGGWSPSAVTVEATGIVKWTEGALPIDTTVTFSRGTGFAFMGLYGFNLRSLSF